MCHCTPANVQKMWDGVLVVVSWWVQVSRKPSMTMKSGLTASTNRRVLFRCSAFADKTWAWPKRAGLINGYVQVCRLWQVNSLIETHSDWGWTKYCLTIDADLSLMRTGDWRISDRDGIHVTLYTTTGKKGRESVRTIYTSGMAMNVYISAGEFTAWLCILGVLLHWMRWDMGKGCGGGVIVVVKFKPSSCIVTYVSQNSPSQNSQGLTSGGPQVYECPKRYL